jgi:SAM-dependent methyltransferase
MRPRSLVSRLAPAVYQYVRKRGTGAPDSFVLDIGTGNGEWATFLREQGCCVAAVDSRPVVGDNGDTLWARAAAESLPFRAERFAGVTAVNAWHWFRGVVAAGECWRILQTSGIMSVIWVDWTPKEETPTGMVRDILLKRQIDWEPSLRRQIESQALMDLRHAGFSDFDHQCIPVEVSCRPEEWLYWLQQSAILREGTPPDMVQCVMQDAAQYYNGQAGDVLTIPCEIVGITGVKTS